MKRTGLILFLMTALLLTLTACGCRHSWEEATCENPRICTLCGETEGEKSGHHWKEAGCEVPQTCSVCGSTQGDATGHTWEEATCETPRTCSHCAMTEGEALSHTFGKWNMEDDKMTRICAVCSHVERTAANREVYFLGNCLGHWNTDSFTAYGSVYSAYGLGDSIGLSLKLEEDSILLSNGYRSFEGTYSFDGYEEKDGNELYRFTGEFEEQEPLHMTYCENEEGAMILVSSGDSVFILKQYPEYTAAMAGWWGAIKDNTVQYLHLKEDHTFEGDLQGSLCGTWHIRAVTEQYGSRYMEILLTPENSFGRAIVLRRSFWGEETDLSRLLKVDENTIISCYLDRTFIQLERMDQQTLELQKNQMEESIENVLGTWVSRERSIDSKVSDEYSNAAMVGYEFTFQSDGTFHGVMEEEKAGTWAFLDKPGDYARYFLYFDENPNDKSWMMELYDDGRMYISYRGETENIHYKLERKQERVYHEAEGPLIGTWYPTVYKVYDPQTQKESSATRIGDFITFNDDGTLTALLGEQCSGIWEYESSMDNGASGTIDTFRLIINGKEEPYLVNSFADGTCSLNYYENDLSYSCGLMKESSKEHVDFVYSGMELILGDWVSTEYMENALSGGNDTYFENTDQYSVSIHPDGTFEYNYHLQGSGTWLYDGFDASSNKLTYTFNYYDPVPFSYRYSLGKDDVLFGWFETETSRIGYYFERAE